MKNMLFITAHLPSDKLPQAGQKIALDLLQDYARNYNVYLVTFINNVELPYFDKDAFVFCRESYFFHMSPFDKFKAIATNIFHPIKASVRKHYDALNIVNDLRKRVSFDVVHFEFTSAAIYLDCFDVENIDTVITEHDVVYQGIERKKKIANILFRQLYEYEYKRQKDWELGILSKAKKIIVLNNKDKALLVGDGISESKICVRKPKIKDYFYNVKRNEVERYSLLFWGALNRRENSDAVRWFIKEVFPKIQSHYNQARIYIVGANPPKDIMRLNSNNVIVTGFVDDPLQYFEKCHIAIAPLRMGAGIKIKVLEYLAAGLTVVTTTVGAEGIDISPALLVADGADSFAFAVCDLFAKRLVV